MVLPLYVSYYLLLMNFRIELPTRYNSSTALTKITVASKPSIIILPQSESKHF
jgi:hypothetical protein